MQLERLRARGKGSLGVRVLSVWRWEDSTLMLSWSGEKERTAQSNWMWGRDFQTDASMFTKQGNRHSSALQTALCLFLIFRPLCCTVLCPSCCGECSLDEEAYWRILWVPDKMIGKKIRKIRFTFFFLKAREKWWACWGCTSRHPGIKNLASRTTD